MKNIEAKIETSDGGIFLSIFDSGSQKFSFPHPYEDVGDRLKIREITKEGVTISYIYSSDYNPRLFYLKEAETLVIKDYLEYEPYKIMISYK